MNINENNFIDPMVTGNLRKYLSENIPAGYGIVCLVVKDTQQEIITNVAPIGVQYALDHAIKSFNTTVDN